MAEFGGLPPLLLAASYQSDSATFSSGQWPSPVPAPVAEPRPNAQFALEVAKLFLNLRKLGIP